MAGGPGAEITPILNHEDWEEFMKESATKLVILDLHSEKDHLTPLACLRSSFRFISFRWV